MRGGPSVAFLLAIVCLARGEEEPRVRRFRIEVLYTIHARLDSDEKLERVRALVLKAYPGAKFAEVSLADRRTYYATYRDRLLNMAGTSLAEITRKVPDEDPVRYGYEIVKQQVAREVGLRSVYEFLHSQAKDDTSFKEILEKLRANDDPKDPVCSTEPGKGLIVYRDFGGKALTGDELTGIEDGGVKFGIGFRPRVAAVGTDDLPKKSRKADTLGDEGHGRQIFRLVAVEK